MQKLQHRQYLRTAQLQREVGVAVRYAKETPSKTILLRDYFQQAVDEITASLPKVEEQK